MAKKKSKKSSLGIESAPPSTGKSEEDYRAQSDARALKESAEICADAERKRRAMKFIHKDRSITDRAMGMYGRGMGKKHRGSRR